MYFNNKYIDFEGFNNTIGDAEPIVPNIVHYINLNNSYVSYRQYLSIISVIRYQKPKLIYLHLSKNKTPSGQYWTDLVKKYNISRDFFRISSLDHTKTIFGVESKFGYKHTTDLLKIEILIQFGGIFLENNIIIAGSMNRFLNYEMTVFSSQNSNDLIENDIFIANQNARFLKTLYDTYR